MGIYWFVKISHKRERFKSQPHQASKQTSVAAEILMHKISSMRESQLDLIKLSHLPLDCFEIIWESKAENKLTDDAHHQKIFCLIQLRFSCFALWKLSESRFNLFALVSKSNKKRGEKAKEKLNPKWNLSAKLNKSCKQIFLSCAAASTNLLHWNFRLRTIN